MLLCVSPMLMSMPCLSSDAYVMLTCVTPMLDVVLMNAQSSGAVSKSSIYQSLCASIGSPCTPPSVKSSCFIHSLQVAE